MVNRFIPISPKQIKRRRSLIFGLVLVSTLLATLKWIVVIPSDAFMVTKIFMTLFFVLTFAWIALFFWSSIFGFVELLRRRNVPGVHWSTAQHQLSSKTAILMPVYNESPSTVFANLLAMAESLKNTGQEKHFDIFVLSDTTNPKVWIEEENLWFETKKLMPSGMNIYYRRRAQNTARKSGNIEDFCHKWGALYDYMIVLDADSLLEGETMVTMAQLMELNSDSGIIQAPPMCVNQNSLFSRIQQFAGKVYGPIVSAGLAYWQVCDSNYWGHNAIIRTRAFIECCGLPKLKGKGPFGGFILSHDFVEAALIARGGWSAWLLPELKGSYEECPPSMIDFAARDRRWCQGNLQHIKVLVSRGLHPVSRVHFLTGIMSYLSSPLWLLFLLAGLSMVLFREFVPPQYFGQTYSLFPEWPVFDKAGTIWLFVLSMAMLLVPKFLGLAMFLRQNRRRQKAGKPGLSVAKTAGGLGLEIVVSTLMAPVMMLFQSKFVFDILRGKSVAWNAQNRGDEGTDWRTAWRVHKWHTILGAITAAAVWKYAHVLFWWLSPITLGLVLSVPLSVFTSRVSVGQWLKTRGWFLIPEEAEKPTVAQRASFWFSELAPFEAGQGGWQMLQQDEMLRRLHSRMLPVNGPAPEFAPEVAEAAAEKVARGEKLEREEEMYLLYKG